MIISVSHQGTTQSHTFSWINTDVVKLSILLMREASFVESSTRFNERRWLRRVPLFDERGLDVEGPTSALAVDGDDAGGPASAGGVLGHGLDGCDVDGPTSAGWRVDGVAGVSGMASADSVAWRGALDGRGVAANSFSTAASSCSFQSSGSKWCISSVLLKSSTLLSCM